MSVEAKFDAAVNASDPLDALRFAVQSLLASGHNSDELATELEDYRKVLQERGREDQEDVVLEVLDFLAGWYSPSMRM